MKRHTKIALGVAALLAIPTAATFAQDSTDTVESLPFLVEADQTATAAAVKALEKWLDEEHADIFKTVAYQVASR